MFFMFRLFELLFPLLFIFFGIRIFTRIIRGVTGNPQLPPGRRSALRGRFMNPFFAPDGASPEEIAAKTDNAFESEVFRLADRQRGRITLSDVVLATGRGMKESENLLEKMADGTHVRMEVDDRGIVVYEFPEIIRRYEG